MANLRAWYLKTGPTAADATVFDDGAADVLTGGETNLDWFFANYEGENTKDRITDLSDEEFAEDLQFILLP